MAGKHVGSADYRTGLAYPGSKENLWYEAGYNGRPGPETGDDIALAAYNAGVSGAQEECAPASGPAPAVVLDPQISNGGDHGTLGGGWTVNLGSPGNYSAAAAAGSAFALLDRTPTEDYLVTFGAVSFGGGAGPTTAFQGAGPIPLVNGNPGPYLLSSAGASGAQLRVTDATSVGTVTITGPITMVPA